MPKPTFPVSLNHGGVFAMLALAVGIAQANPVAPVIQSGSAVFATTSRSLTVTNSSSSIINWQSFSIASGEATRFGQQSTATTVLNRVGGSDQQRILGVLTSNGRTLLVNPNGTPFNPVARNAQGSSTPAALPLAIAPSHNASLPIASAPRFSVAPIPSQGGVVALQLAKRDLTF